MGTTKSTRARVAGHFSAVVFIRPVLGPGFVSGVLRQSVTRGPGGPRATAASPAANSADNVCWMRTCAKANRSPVLPRSSMTRAWRAASSPCPRRDYSAIDWRDWLLLVIGGGSAGSGGWI